ncbi:MAG: YebC/PmpR family DNA-binding transcriptional regulator [Bacteroidia bacterium]|nr:YebC/PmpR family DNA-binding transcriptional regulator [Bacteroidia bacterium]
MGRIFEKRKETMFKRYAKMAKAFTKIGRDIVIAVKSGGPDPALNPKLRLVLANAKAVNMPKANIEAAIKRATEKNTGNYEEIIYEGYAPHGVAMLVECTSDNPTRTVANVRMYFNRAGGSLGTSGSVSFMFEHKAVFKIPVQKVSRDEMEFELIDYGLEELNEDPENNQWIIITAFKDFGKMAEFLENKNIEIIESNKIYVPVNTVELGPGEFKEIEALIEKMEEDDDIANVYHNAVLSGGH